MFCNWLHGNGREFYHFIVFSDDSQFTWEYTRNYKIQISGQKLILIAQWKLILNSNFTYGMTLYMQLIEPFIFFGILTDDIYLQFLQDVLAQSVEDVPLETRFLTYLQHNEVKLVFPSPWELISTDISQSIGLIVKCSSLTYKVLRYNTTWFLLMGVYKVKV